MVRLNKAAHRMIRLSVFFVCSVLLLLFIADVFLGLSPAVLLGRYLFVKAILTQKAAPQMSPPNVVFKEYILDPIPESITNIRADQPEKHSGYRYVLRFNINKSDVAMLINSGPLKRIWNVKYENGYLEWAWDTWNGHSLNGTDIIVYYPDDSREPAWFKPHLWDNFEAYAFEEKVDGTRNTKVFLFNEKEGEAYFIVSSLR